MSTTSFGLATSEDIAGLHTLGVPDASPPLVPLAPGGTDVAEGSDEVLIPASAGRIKVEINHAGTAGRVWLGFDRAAQVGVGNFLDPGEYWSEFYTGEVHALLDGTTTAQRITWQEWAA